MPELPNLTLEEARRFDFLEGLRLHNYSKHVPAVLDHYSRSVAAAEAIGEARPGGPGEASRFIEHDPLYQFAAGIQRHAAVMGWSAAIESLRPYVDRLREVVSELPPHDKVRLELDPNLELPGYLIERDLADGEDIHLVPGGYWGDLLVGPVYERGGGLHRTAWRTGYSTSSPGALIAFAGSAHDSQYEHILDLGCAFGSNTMAHRHAYPNASEVIGIDLSEPALRWAYLAAVERDVSVRFEQRDARMTGYEDESFDLVTSFLLAHEVPAAVLDDILAESFRVLRPGGQIRFLEHPPYHALDPAVAFLQSFDYEANGERFWNEFLSRDFLGSLGHVGFVNATEGPLDYDEPNYWGSATLMRAGEHRPENRWVTEAWKPG